MKCPSCGYDNAEDALACNLCQVVLKKEEKKAPAPTEEPKLLDSPDAIKALLQHVLRLGKEAAKTDPAALRGEIPRLAGRLFLETKPLDALKLVLEPTAENWLQIVAPKTFFPEKHAAIRVQFAQMYAALSTKRFGDAFKFLQAADAAAGKHQWMELLILGLGLKRATETLEPGRAKPIAAPREPAKAPALKPGDVLGRAYEISGVLGEGGFGVVYLARHISSDTAVALKTFREEHQSDAETVALFRKEAQTLVDLDPHPHLLKVYHVDEIHGRLFVALEYVPPGPDGANSLEGKLKRRPPDLAQALRWAIQFCHGMEFAESKGLKAHRDIKPANIMIDPSGRLMISDFGLAGALRLPGVAMGTPTHMPPEQFLGVDRCDHRSDIYSFGVVLYQMAARGRPPFWAQTGSFWEGMRKLHSEAAPPPLESPLFPVIARCLAKNPLDRFQSFRLLRESLEALLAETTGEKPAVPELETRAWYNWDTKGASLLALGRFEEALDCFDKALALEKTAQSWSNKALALRRLKRLDEALACLDQALALDNDDHVWVNKAAIYLTMKRDQEAAAACDEALKLNPASYGAWNNKGAALYALRRYEECVAAADRAIAIDPGDPRGYQSRSGALQELGRLDEALATAERSLTLNPHSAEVWANKGLVLRLLKRFDEALACLEKATRLDAGLVHAWAGKRLVFKELGRLHEASLALDKELELDPAHGPTWLEKGKEHADAQRWKEALECMEKAVAFEPEWPFALCNRAMCLSELGHLEEAAADYGKAFAMKPDYYAAGFDFARMLVRLGRRSEALPVLDAVIAGEPSKNTPQRVMFSTYLKADCLHHLGRFEEAIPCYAKAAETGTEKIKAGAVEAIERCRRREAPVT
jgi:tetratricopeptide (TPR) repeat protein